ncbi:MAG TPA: efflux RND transporter periplasmic adaptor subunit [Burkholderiales bacterium]|nr:efflux RND transporter periplasmic adaptor subunit [Burkholderiales bacterium]
MIFAGLAALVADAGARAATFECLIQPNQIVEIRSPAEGLIGKVLVQRGDSVKAGQALVELESTAERSAVATAKYRSEMTGRIKAASERVQYASTKAGRAAELQKQHFVAAQAHDDAQAEMRVAQADLEDAKENQQLARLDYQHQVDVLNLRTLRAPFDGVVMDRMLNPGDLTQYGTETKPILKLAQIHPLRVEVVLPIDYYKKLSLGMEGFVIPERLGGRHPARVKVIDRVFDAASGTFGVRLELPNPRGAVPGGIRCQVDFPELKGPERRPSPPSSPPSSQ